MNVIKVEDFGTFQRVTRKAKNISRRKLAEKSGYSAGHIANVEEGFNKPSAEYMANICEVLDFDFGIAIIGRE